MAFKSLESVQVIIDRDAAKSLLNLGSDTVGAAGVLDGTVARLLTDTENIGPDTPFGDLQLASLLGSSTVALTYGAAVNQGADKVTTRVQIDAVAGSSPTEEEIKGVAIVNAAADDWIAIAPISPAVPIEQAGDGLSMDLAIQFDLVQTTAQ